MAVFPGRGLVPLGPQWQWWTMDRNHWVGYPDRRVAVVDIDDEWLQNILKYLAGWTEERTDRLADSWWMRSGYFSGATSDYGDIAIGHEIDQLTDQTHREWLTRFLVPCLESLEQEAGRRGFEVPAIPAYQCFQTLRRVRHKAEWDAAEELRQSRTPPLEDLPSMPPKNPGRRRTRGTSPTRR
jgi:hypothetical protein